MKFTTAVEFLGTNRTGRVRRCQLTETLSVNLAAGEKQAKIINWFIFSSYGFDVSNISIGGKWALPAVLSKNCL